MALHTQLDIYRSAFDLACAAVAAVVQMRRDAKPVVGRIMVDECFAIVRHIRLANMAADEGKETHLLQLLDSLTNVETALRISRDMRFIATSASAARPAPASTIAPASPTCSGSAGGASMRG